MIHLIFALSAFLLWRVWDRKPDFSNYFKVAATVGIIITLVFDFTGIYILRFWGYYSTTYLEYFAIAFGTYVIATPLFVETLGYFHLQFSKFKLNYKFNVTKSGAFTLFMISSIVLWGTGYIIHNNHVSADWPLLIGLFIFVLTFFDSLGFLIRGIKGPILSVFEGKIFAPLSVLVSGFLAGFLWEILNTYFPLWYYQNLPKNELFGVPLLVIVFWGTLNMAFWVCTNIVFGESYKSKK